jgi:porphobilinogen synthase
MKAAPATTPATTLASAPTTDGSLAAGRPRDAPVIPPVVRPRRLRRMAGLRHLVRETCLAPSDFVYPLFVRPGRDVERPIASMPGQYQRSVDRLGDEARRISALGIPAVILFGIPETKDALGSDACRAGGIVPRAIRALKEAAPELAVIADLCFCEYTDHGHCGRINRAGDDHYSRHLPEGYLLNDPTLALLQRAAVVHAEAGADVVAPSGMIDGMVGAIRTALDRAGFEHVAVLSYAAKYASAFYGPFREAAESRPGFGDRSQSQLDPANGREALREVALDVAEGADVLMVKPALPYLDVVSAVRRAHDLPVAAYQVSGEYAMLHAAAANGWVDLRQTALESLIGIKRAGADMILTYFAKDAARWLVEAGPLRAETEQRSAIPWTPS